MARHQLFLFSVPCIAGARRGHGDADSAPPSPQVKISVDSNFVYDTTGTLIVDKYLQGESSKNALVHFYCRTAVYCALRNSKLLKISYDWRGMPVEFIQVPQPTGVSGDTLYKMAMAYDGTGRRISKTRWVKARGDAGWSRRHATQQELNLWLEPGEVHLLFSSISEAKGMLLNGGIKMYNAAQQCIDEAFEKIEPVMQPE